MIKNLTKWILSIFAFILILGFINWDDLHNRHQETAQSLEQQREQQINHLAAALSAMFGGH